MSIRPVDLQIIIPRATDVSRAQQAADQQLSSQQQQFAEQWQQIAADRQQTVQQTPKTQGGKIHREKEKEEDQHTKKRQSSKPDGILAEDKTVSKDESHGNGKFTDPVLGHLIDIKT